MTEHWYIVNDICLAFLGSRPPYCDRGRFHAVIEVGCWKSDSDPWPRYYFNLERGKAEVLDYLRIKFREKRIADNRIITVDGGEWVEMKLDETGEKMVRVTEGDKG